MGLLLVLGAIVLSLGLALYQLASGRGDSGNMLRSLTVRIALSVALFILLMVAWRMGLISPHGVSN